MLRRTDLQGFRLVDLVQGAPRLVDVLLDLGNGGFRLLDPAVHQEPARAFRQMTADEEDHEAEGGAEKERHPPGVRHRKVLDDQEEERRRQQGAAPVGAVDGDVDPPPVLAPGSVRRWRS